MQLRPRQWLRRFARKKQVRSVAVSDYRTANTDTTVCVVGLGNQGLKLATWAAAMGYRLAGACDLRSDRLEAFRQAHRFVPVTTTVRELPQADICIVATLPPGRRQLVEALCEQGLRRILCEKPIADTLETAAWIWGVDRRSACRIRVNHPYFWSPDYARLKGLLDGQAVGPLESIDVSFKPKGFANIGCHQFAMVLQATDATIGEVERAWFNTETGLSRGAGLLDPNGRAVCRLSTGVPVRISNDHSWNASRTVMTFNCSGGRIEMCEESRVMRITDLAGHTEADVVYTCACSGGGAALSARHRLLDSALSALLSDTPDGNVATAYRALEAVVGAQVSYERQASVRFPLDPATATPFRFS